jgi:hypothetical protein
MICWGRFEGALLWPTTSSGRKTQLTSALAAALGVQPCLHLVPPDIDAPAWARDVPPAQLVCKPQGQAALPIAPYLLCPSPPHRIVHVPGAHQCVCYFVQNSVLDVLRLDLGMQNVVPRQGEAVASKLADASPALAVVKPKRPFVQAMCAHQGPSQLECKVKDASRGF